MLAWLCGCGPMDVPQAQDAMPTEQETQGIEGGTNASIATFPWQAELRIVGGTHHCGGAILSPDYILTARHCISGRKPSDFRVGVGSSKRSTLPSEGQMRDVADFILHPSYNPNSFKYDVALLKLASPLTLTGPNARAIPLATSVDEAAGRTAPGAMATFTGWGQLGVNNTTLPDTLQKMTVSVFSKVAADAVLPPLDAVTVDQLPAGHAPGGICPTRGDSGGPLVVDGASGKILAGVASLGFGCGLPSLYAKVSHVEPWVAGIRARTPVERASGTQTNTLGGDWTHYLVTVPVGTYSLNARLSGGSGNANLYVHTSSPNTSTYTCRSVDSGTEEYCALSNPAAGTWYVSVYGAGPYANVSVRAATY
ncbi:trypsin-like serine protease [Corallococcus terminator]